MSHRPRCSLALFFGMIAVLVVPACGGGSGGAGPGGAGQNLVLVSFMQAGVDNSPINVQLEFTFSEPVDPDSVTSGAMQIREGPDFGRTARGSFHVEGSKVYFAPALPVDCALQTAGFKPGTTYRITVAGWPETYCIKNTKGQPLDRTTTQEFITLPESADDVLQDQIPSQAPFVVSTSPENARAAVTVAQGNEVVIELSENIDPCTVGADSALFQVFELGDPDLANAVDAPNGNPSGFDPATDSAPGDPYSWGAFNSTPLTPPQVIPAEIQLTQDFESTFLTLRPLFGEFPDNALIVVELTFGIRDFGGDALNSTRFKFTTENREPQDQTFSIEFDATTPIDDGSTTADVNTARSPSRAQGWLLFAGDGDNGSSPTATSPPPSFPTAINSNCDYRVNYGQKTVFDPASNVTLNTGATRNSLCSNLTDGSTAVVWEFASIHIRSGITVRIIGSNPAILLSQGDVVIESGGSLLVRGDGQGGSPKGDGQAGNSNYTTSPVGGPGGEGVAGAGDGGDAHAAAGGSTSSNTQPAVSFRGEDGFDGFGSEDDGVQGGRGSGEGNSGQWGDDSVAGAGGGGGGAGHADVGLEGGHDLYTGSSPAHVWIDGAYRGGGGDTYPDAFGAERMITPQAGSGGGAGGSHNDGYSSETGAGGGGGAGGGFVDITAGGDILVFGTIDAAGGRGGNGTRISSTYYGGGGGGGGGGSGGGIRLLTPNDINLAGGTLTAAGGSGGSSAVSPNAAGAALPNLGGAGGVGRIVLEDGDSIISNLGNAYVLPTEGSEGFYRGLFDPTRFQGGGAESVATTGLMFLGPISPPSFHVPERADFVAGIPSEVSNGDGRTSILVEAQGYPLLPDGSPDLASPTGWYTAGYFASSVSGAAWVEGANPADVPVPIDNVGAGLLHLDGSSYVQVRVTFWLPSGTAASQPGPFLDRWGLRFSYDQ